MAIMMILKNHKVATLITLCVGWILLNMLAEIAIVYAEWERWEWMKELKKFNVIFGPCVLFAVTALYWKAELSGGGFMNLNSMGNMDMDFGAGAFGGYNNSMGGEYQSQHGY
jgi:hypothetical protein